MTPQQQAIDELYQCMTGSERKRALQIVDRLLAQGWDEHVVVRDVLNPALVKIGALWACEAVSLSQTFVAAKIAEDILHHCFLEMKQGRSMPIAPKGPVVLGNIEDDFHGLGRRIVGTFLRSAGWEVHDLGNDVPAEDFVEMAVAVDAPVIGVSAMMQTTALGIQNIRSAIDRKGLKDKVRLAVGGAVFTWRPQLAEEVGADGMATNAVEADALLLELKHQVRKEDP